MIKFKEISFKNFLSTGNTFQTIYLDRTPSALITGHNGAGKSTMLDALCFGIFNKPYRNINKPQLINSVNEKGLLVEVLFEVNSVNYKVVRGIKPTVFEVYREGELIPHDAAIKDYQKKLEDIIGLDYGAFTQIAILGSARYQSFMDLNSTARRNIIEEILDITVFSRMNTVLKQKSVDLDLEIKDNEYQKEIINTKISAQRGLIDNLRKRTAESKEKIDAEIKRLTAERDLRAKELKGQIDQLGKVPREDLEELRKTRQQVEKKFNALERRIKDTEDRIIFLQNTNECHECGQVIPESMKADKQHICEIDLGKMYELKPTAEKAVTSINEQVNEATNNREVYVEIETTVRGLTNEIETINNMVDSLTAQTSDADEGDMEAAQEALNDFNNDLQKLEAWQYKMVEKRQYYDICKILLKDSGIKAKIIKQYVPVMNKLINQFLDKMGANYSFNLDEEFNEVIKSRYRDNFSYASFSEGEKMRIDLALMFTWREIAKLKNSVNTNLLIMDEVGDSSLDGEATDALWEICGDMKDTNVFVISHKAQNVERFRTHIEFYKEGNFSKIKDSIK